MAFGHPYGRWSLLILEQARATQRRNLLLPSDEEQLTDDIVALALRYGRYGYRRITAMLRREHWEVNHKRVERIWRRE
jgi:putative transposase